MRRRPVITAIAAIGAVGTLVAAQQGAQAAATPGHATSVKAVARAALRPKLGPGGRVIVLLKNHTTSFSADSVTQRRSARVARTDVASLAKKIHHAGGTVTHSYSLINGLAARVSHKEADALAADPRVQKVVPDEPITEAGTPSATPAAAQPPTAPVAKACAPNGGTQLDPEALEATRADSDVPGAKTARSLGYTGKGVTVGWIADGIDIDNPEFIRNGKSIFTDYEDFGGDGTNSPTGGDEAFLDASAIAAQGNKTYDVSKFSDLPLNTACKIRIEGEAPGVNLVGLNIFGAEDTGYNSSFIQAIQYATTVDHVNVLNESLGSNPYPDDSGALDAVKAANDAAVAQGVTITASSGDAGVTNTIGSPAGDPNVITVGASTTYRFYLQTGYGGARLPGITGWLDNNISSLSSGGFDENTRTVDLVAPGDLNWAACTADPTQYSECADFTGNPSDIEESGGTSESAPVTAGVAALVIEAYRAGHGGASPTPAVVKQILTSTADDIRAPAQQQGAGLVDAYKAVQLARSYEASTNSSSNPVTRTGHTITTATSQFNATAAPATPEKFSETITNSGTTAQTITPSARTLGAYSQIKQANVTLSDASSPKYVDFQGITDNLETIKFTVPKGESRLNASIAFQGASLTDLHARVRMDLVDPDGRLASYSLPQGNGNYGNSQVADPVAGTWTAYITSRDSADGGTEGPVQFAAKVAKFVPFGSVSPATLTLTPGQSGTVTLSTRTLGKPGDKAGSLVLTTGTTGAGVPGTTTVPITMRSLIPTGKQSFTDTLTGGNGRATYTGETFFYSLDLPKGDPALNAYVSVPDSSNSFYDYLVSPNGNAVATGANQVLTSIDGGTEPVGEYTNGAQAHVLKPAAGRWTLVVVFAPQVSGTAISDPITVSTNQIGNPASVRGVPASIPSGKTANATVTVTNRGNSPEAFFLDPRLDSTSTYALAPLTSATSDAPLHYGDSIPEYVVPTETSAIAAASRTTGSTNIQFDSSAPSGDPDYLSNVGKTVSAQYAASPVSQGVWAVIPTEVGPFPTAGTPETVTSAAVARTQTFDTSAVPATGDLWLSALDPDATLNTITVNPGQTATIPVTIHATGKARTVHGTFYVDDADLFSVYGGLAPNGNEVAAIHYSYRITTTK